MLFRSLFIFHFGNFSILFALHCLYTVCIYHIIMYLSCSTVANRFVSEYGLVRLSIGEAMRRVLMEQPKTDLAKAITKHLIKGLTVPDELAVQALDICLMDMRCQTRG